MTADWERAFERAEQARAAIERLVSMVESEELNAEQAFALADRDELAGRTFTIKVLEVLPGIGKVKSRRALAELGIDAEAPIASLSAPDRDRILDAFASLR